MSPLMSGRLAASLNASSLEFGSTRRTSRQDSYSGAGYPRCSVTILIRER